MKKITFLLLLTGFWAFGQNFSDVTGSLPQLSFGFSAWGDYDGDGDLDLYFTGQLNANSNGGGLYENDNGTFTLVTNSGLPLCYLGAAKWGDMDNDGDLDLVVTGNDGSNDLARVYRNNGNGTFSNVNAGLTDVYLGDVDLGDIDGDGLLDILIGGNNSANSVDLVKVYMNNGSNNFAELTTVSLPPINNSKVKFVDFDGDGDLDITLHGWDNTSSSFYTKVWQNDGTQNFTELSLGLPQLWLGDFEWGDVDADGDLDLVIIGTAGLESEAHLMLNSNNTFTEDPHFSNVMGAHRFASLELADFDNDGDLDIFLTGMNVDNLGNEILISKMYDNSGFGVFTENTADTFAAAQYSDADAADYDNDGNVDLFVTGVDNNFWGIAKLYHNDHPGAVDEVFVNKFNIYPNPAHNIINIENPDNFNYTISMSDLTGKNILTQTATGTTNLDVSNFPSGMYLIKISDSQNSFIKKIVIK